RPPGRSPGPSVPAPSRPPTANGATPPPTTASPMIATCFHVHRGRPTGEGSSTVANGFPSPVDPVVTIGPPALICGVSALGPSGGRLLGPLGAPGSSVSAVDTGLGIAL